MREIKEDIERETSFWREMVKECTDDETSNYQHMREALSLAEYKLAEKRDSYH